MAGTGRPDRIAILVSPSWRNADAALQASPTRLVSLVYGDGAGRKGDRERPTWLHASHWENWAPGGWFDEATFGAVARAFDNPDWVAVTLLSYRSRWDEETPDPASEWLEKKVKQTKTLSLPAIFFQGDDDGVNPPATSEEVHEKFTGPFERILLQNVGHFPQREDPETVARNLHHFLLS